MKIGKSCYTMNFKIAFPTLFVFLSLVFTEIKAQEIAWFEADHEWYFKRFCEMPPFPCGYFHYTVGENLEIGGHEAVSVLEELVDQNGTSLGTETHYFRTSGDSVYHYYEPSDSWYLLYSFNTPVGETWVVQGDEFVGYGSEDDLENSRFEVLVDSINTIEVAGVPRRVVYTSAVADIPNNVFSAYWFNDGIIEGVGAVGASLFGDSFMITVGTPPEFSCFYENEEIVYGPFAYPCLPMSTTDQSPGTLSLSPNPASRSVSITLPETVSGNLVLQLYDLSGRLVHTASLTASPILEVEVPPLAKGIYTVRVSAERGSFTGKLLLE